MKTHRKPAVAGMFYPGDANTLTRHVEGYLSSATRTSDNDTRFIIAPHAGYVYSGAVAAEAFAEVSTTPYERVVLLGPSHRYPFKGGAESEESVWQLPNGEARIKSTGFQKILRDARYHENEHCLEVQFPFLLHIMPDAEFSPILLSGSHDIAVELADTLLPLDSDRTLWVISSDFNHVGPQFRHQPQSYGFESGEAMDRQAIQLIEAGDIKGFTQFLRKTDATICGALPILTAMHLIQALKRRNFVFKKYDCSSNQTGDINSVGYAALYS